MKRLAVASAWAVTAAVFFKTLCARIHDPDLWWQLASGREMVARRALLRSDVFTHTMAGARWVDFEWLSQLALYGLFHVFGPRALFFSCIGLGLSAVLLIVLACRSLGARGPWLLLCGWLAFVLLRPRLTARVELFTFVFMAAELLLLLRARRLATARRWTPWACAALMAVWCNLHGGFLYGLGLAALLDVGARWAGEDRSYIRMLDACAALMAGAALLNPYGPALFSIFRETAAQVGAGGALIQEWRPASFSALPLFWGAAIACVAALIVGVAQGWRPARFWAPATACFAAFGGLYYRGTPFLAFAAAPFAACALAELGRRLPGKAQSAAWLCAALALGPLYGNLAKRIPADPVNWTFFPVGACRFIERNGVDGVMYNAYDFGGYVEWALGPGRQAFMDGRMMFYPLLREDAALDRRLGEGLSANPWPAYLSRRGVDYAIMDYEDLRFPYQGAPFPLALTNLMFPRSDWALVFWDDSGMVFLRREKRNEALIKKFEYRALWPYNPEQNAYLISSGEVSAAAALGELARHESEAPGFSVLAERLRAVCGRVNAVSPRKAIL